MNTRRAQHIAFVGSMLAGLIILIALIDNPNSGQASIRQEPFTRRCTSAIYSTPVARGRRPQSFNAVYIGLAIFNDLKGAKDHLDAVKINGKTRYYTYKSPLTVWAAPSVVVDVRRSSGNLRLLYDNLNLNRLSTKPTAWTLLPTRGQFQTCTETPSGRQATQYNGGFAIRRPGCYKVTVRVSDRQPVSQKVAFGKPACKSS